MSAAWVWSCEGKTKRCWIGYLKAVIRMLILRSEEPRQLSHRVFALSTSAVIRLPHLAPVSSGFYQQQSPPSTFLHPHDSQHTLLCLTCSNMISPVKINSVASNKQWGLKDHSLKRCASDTVTTKSSLTLRSGLVQWWRMHHFDSTWKKLYLQELWGNHTLIQFY